jgi:Family of unknown function (DUF6065)
MRATQYCDALTTASGFGWWMFAPVEIALKWDGKAIFWSQDGVEWQVIDDTVHFPGFPDAFDAQAPQSLQGMAPPFLMSLPEPGLIQVSLGLIARTSPGWSMLIRRPPNFAFPGHIEHFEGVVDTSEWSGPLFINLRLTRTDVPIRLRADIPLAQAQPIPNFLLTPTASAFQTVNELGPREWEAYRISVAEPHSRPGRAHGAYAAEQRRRRRGIEAHACTAGAQGVGQR